MNQSTAKQTICAQLRIGDTELPTYRLADILARIDAAQKLAGMNRLLFLPTHNDGVNKSILRHCRKRGLEVHLWYKVLTDNDIMPEASELMVDPYGGRGKGETALWGPIFNSEENFAFACPANQKYNNLILDACQKRLDGYDGLFCDYIGYPLASLGFESLFTCFCPSCVEREPRMAAWRNGVRELRESIGSWTDETLEKVGDFFALLDRFGLGGFYDYRTALITALIGRYAALAHDAGVPFGLDILNPALSIYAGHDFAASGKLADYLKPRIYSNTYGPSSIPLEFYCMGMGLKTWARQLSIPAIMDFIGRSTDLEMHNLAQQHLSKEATRQQIDKAIASTASDVYPGIECSLHPDYESFVDESTVAEYARACRNSPGLVMSWNMLFIPDVFLRIVGESLTQAD